MQHTTVQHKQTSKSWVNAESLLKFTSTGLVTIPHDARYAMSHNPGFTISFVCQKPTTAPSTDQILIDKLEGNTGFRFGFKAGYTNRFTISLGYGTSTINTTLTYSAVAGSLMFITLSFMYTTVNEVLGYCNGQVFTALSVGSDPLVDNTKGITLGGLPDGTLKYKGTMGFLSWINREVQDIWGGSQLEGSRLYEQIGIIPKNLHANCVGFWTMQERYGNKVYDSVEGFNYVKQSGNYLTQSTGTAMPNPPYGGWTGNVTGGSTDHIYIGTSTVGAVASNTITLTKALNKLEFWFYRPWNVNFTINIKSGSTVIATQDVVVPNQLENVHWDFNNIPSGTYTVEIVYTGANGGTPYILYSKLAIHELQLTPNHGDLIGYTDAELGITDKTTQTAKLDFYTKTTANFWNGSGNEIKSGLPELKNALLLDATHTISFPLSGTVVKTFKGYTYQAYRLKTGESLTPKEVIELDNNGLFANPSSSIKRKLDAYYNFNSIDTTSGNRILDLIGTNHATLTGSDFTIVTINSLR